MDEMLKVQQVSPIHTEKKIIWVKKIRAPLNTLPNAHGSSLEQVQWVRMLDAVQYLLVCMSSAIRMIPDNGPKHAIDNSLVVMQNFDGHIGCQDSISQNGIDTYAPKIEASMSGNAAVGKPWLESCKGRQARFSPVLPCLILECMVGHDDTKIFGV